MNRILVAEDEPQIAAFIAKGLRKAGFAPTTVGTAGEARALLNDDDDFGLLVLDLGLPDQNGLALLRQLRAELNPIPVIVLTARTSVKDTVAALDGGADDYMTKPFHFEELLARIRRRYDPSSASDPTVLSYGSLSLDLNDHRATTAKGQSDLSAREFAIAELFLRNPSTVLTREQILTRVWGYDYDLASNVVDVYIRYLRNKLGAEYISTVRGLGYRLVHLPPAEAHLPL